MDMDITIYGLQDPEDQSIRYVGQSNSPMLRLGTHMSCPGSKRMRWWIRDLRSKDLRPTLIPLEVVADSEAHEAEAHWIDVVGRRHSLLNVRLVPAVKSRTSRAPGDKEIAFWLDAAAVKALAAEAARNERSLSQEARLRIRESLQSRVDKAVVQ